MSMKYRILTLLTWRWHAVIYCCSCGPDVQKSYLDCNDFLSSYRRYHFNLYLNQQVDWKAENRWPYCNNTSAGIRFSDQQMHTRQPSQCKMCRSVGVLNKELRRGDVADLSAKGGAVGTFIVQNPDSVCFHSKGLKTDKLPAHLFEIDEDAKDEVSGGASECKWSAFDPLDYTDYTDLTAKLSVTSVVWPACSVTPQILSRSPASAINSAHRSCFPLPSCRMQINWDRGLSLRSMIAAALPRQGGGVSY